MAKVGSMGLMVVDSCHEGKVELAFMWKKLPSCCMHLECRTCRRTARSKGDKPREGVAAFDNLSLDLLQTAQPDQPTLVGKGVCEPLDVD